jgi:uncharacterized protein (DUF433 family)
LRKGDTMKTEVVYIVDRGRGPQLSTSRITVQDLVPYIQQKCTYEQILEIMPVLTVEEIQAVEHYIQENYETVMELDQRIRERAAARSKSPEVEEAERLERLKRLENVRQQIDKRKQERNGDLAAG